MAAAFDREAIRVALALADPAVSSYLDLEDGSVVVINDLDTSADTEALRNRVMDSYGDRYRYIPGGNAAADDSAVSSWLEAEGL